MSESLQNRPHTRHPVSLAPMVDKTDRDWRWIMRQITRKTLLYTEMITAPAIIRGHREKLLGFDPAEKPLVLQLGWDDPAALAEASRIAEDYGYDEISLNCGCPSDRVQQHNFGASLMARAGHTARLVESMASAVSIPVTVKNRIGIRSREISLETYENLTNFISTIAGAGCRKFTVHARIAILEGLSPKENRDIPPLRYEDVYRLKNDFPDLFIEINGGFKTPDEIDGALGRVDAVMLGRLALDNPWMLSCADRRWFDSEETAANRRDVLEAAVPYISRRAAEGASKGLLIQPLMNLFHGCKGSKDWKRALMKLPSVPVNEFSFALSQVVEQACPAEF